MPDHNITIHCVYRIVCFPTGYAYIGQTVNRLARKTAHFWALKKNTHFNPHLQNAFNKYGQNAFYFEILEDDISPDLIDVREMFWIRYFDSVNNGYNIAVGGQLPSTRISLCTWNGIEYRSQAECARALGISSAAMSLRLSRGMTCDKNVAGFADYKRRQCVWNGIEYESYSAAAKANGVSRDVIRKRINQGYKSDYDLRPCNMKRCAWNGIEYDSIADCAKANSVTLSTMRERLTNGYTCDDDMKRPRQR